MDQIKPINEGKMEIEKEESSSSLSDLEVNVPQQKEGTGANRSEQDKHPATGKESSHLKKALDTQAKDKYVDPIKSRETTRMGGSTKKRYVWLLKNGYTEEEAKTLCRDPIGTHPPKQAGLGVGKRLRPDDSMEGNKSKGKRTKLSTSQRSEGPGKGKVRLEPPSRTYRDAVGLGRVGIIPVDFPTNKISEEQFKALDKEILRHILEGSEPGPQFINVSVRDGWVSITCANSESVEWVLKTAHQLKPWEGADLKGIREAEFPRRKTLVVYLPKAGDLTDDEITGLLKRQNPDLEVKSWSLTRRQEVNNATQVSFAIDESSAEGLKNEVSLYFRWGRVRHHVVGNRAEEEAGDKKEGEEEREEAMNVVEEGLPVSSEPLNPQSGPSTSTPSGKGKSGGKLKRPSGVSPLKVPRQ